MARERMGIYADIGTFEAFAKLGVCYLLSAIPVYYLDNTISDSIIKSVLIVVIVALSSYTFLDKLTKMKVNLLIRNKIHR